MHEAVLRRPICIKEDRLCPFHGGNEGDKSCPEEQIDIYRKEQVKVHLALISN